MTNWHTITANKISALIFVLPLAIIIRLIMTLLLLPLLILAVLFSPKRGRELCKTFLKELTTLKINIKCDNCGVRKASPDNFFVRMPRLPEGWTENELHHFCLKCSLRDRERHMNQRYEITR